jgi:hypothetical protein
MPMATPASLLRPDVLHGLAVVAEGRYAAACAGLGATVSALDADPLDEEGLAAAAAALDRVDTLVVDTGAAFAAGGLPALRTALDGAWNQARAVGVAHWVDRDAGGKIVLVAPRPDSGEHAGALVAALENVARTLGIEWARHDVRATVLVPGAAVTQDELDAFVAYLASRAGDYFSGCRFDVGG